VDINQEVQQSYLKTRESEQNIATIETAIEQAKENLRITEERYKEQVSTITDVLVAQTLFTQTMTNYYNALYDYKIAKAVLYRAIGRETLE
jgi:outer membrane protein